MIIKNKVYITATSSVTCAGNTNKELFENICQGTSKIEQDRNYFHDSTPSIGKIKSNNTFNENLILCIDDVLKLSSLENFNDTLLIIGSSVGGMDETENSFFKANNYEDINISKHNIQAVVNTIQKKHKFYDDISFSTACTSSANAIGYAKEVLQKGVYKNVLVVGLDSLCKTTVGGFLSLGVLSSSPCKPFDVSREGMNVAEGIAALLMQTKKTKDCVEVCGVGYSSDAFHMTQPHPDGSKTAMQNALNESNIKAEQISYINAHGTGTRANDESEGNSIALLFSNKAKVSSTKSITGHTLGAAGALEAIISCMVILNDTIPTSTFLDEVENKHINFSLETTKENVDFVLSNSFAFGGNNCSIVFGKVKGE